MFDTLRIDPSAFGTSLRGFREPGGHSRWNPKTGIKQCRKRFSLYAKSFCGLGNR